jgi:hypothetical protein
MKSTERTGNYIREHMFVCGKKTCRCMNCNLPCTDRKRTMRSNWLRDKSVGSHEYIIGNI